MERTEEENVEKYRQQRQAGKNSCKWDRPKHRKEEPSEQRKISHIHSLPQCKREGQQQIEDKVQTRKGVLSRTENRVLLMCILKSLCEQPC